ncbi:uncharacterized protein isoform X2 [Leptinotarsa decemlineata]|uniref:uncharacterized protein isoform X2 n=1 Tax=Leptinotarsa decemlineata TaxID=7539 RepID=UPI003D30D67F
MLVVVLGIEMNRSRRILELAQATNLTNLPVDIIGTNVVEEGQTKNTVVVLSDGSSIPQLAHNDSDHVSSITEGTFLVPEVNEEINQFFLPDYEVCDFGHNSNIVATELEPTDTNNGLDTIEADNGHTFRINKSANVDVLQKTLEQLGKENVEPSNSGLDNNKNGSSASSGSCYNCSEDESSSDQSEVIDANDFELTGIDDAILNAEHGNGTKRKLKNNKELPIRQKNKKLREQGEDYLGFSKKKI